MEAHVVSIIESFGILLLPSAAAMQALQQPEREERFRFDV